MKIAFNAISAGYYRGLEKANQKDLKQNQNNPIKDHSTQLTDGFYNKLLVKKSSVSFKGNDDISKTNDKPLSNLEKKVISVMQFMNQGDVLVVGNNNENDKKLLKENSNIFSSVIKRVYFVEDKNLKGTFAIYQGNLGAPNLANLGKGSIVINHENNQKSFVHSNRGTFINDSDSIQLGNISIRTDRQKDVDFKEISNEIKLVTMPAADNKSIEKLNLKNMEQFFQKNNDKIKTAKTIKFSDVGGMDDVIGELKKSVLYPIKFPTAFKNTKLNHGIILHGGPGTGKTYVAQALANEATAHFVKINGPELESKWVGESEENWRNIFNEAVENQPSIVFIDEIDAVAKNREGSDQSRNDDKIVNQLLTIMSDLEKNNDQVFVIAATNKLELLDSAITRSGRFGKHIEVKNPSLEGCKAIFDIHTKNKKISAGFDSTKFIDQLYLQKATGADIEHIANEANSNAFERLGIYEKMENNTFKQSDVDNFEIAQKDFDKALKDFIEQSKSIEEAKTKKEQEVKEKQKLETIEHLRTVREFNKQIEQEENQNIKEKKNKIGFVQDTAQGVA